MRVLVRENLPIHPRDPSLTNIISPGLDVPVAIARGVAAVTVLILVRVVVAHPPFLHDQLLARGFRHLDVGRQLIHCQIAVAVRVDREDIKRVARKEPLGQRCVNSTAAPRSNKDVALAT